MTGYVNSNSTVAARDAIWWFGLLGALLVFKALKRIIKVGRIDVPEARGDVAGWLWFFGVPVGGFVLPLAGRNLVRQKRYGDRPLLAEYLSAMVMFQIAFMVLYASWIAQSLIWGKAPWTWISLLPLAVVFELWMVFRYRSRAQVPSIFTR